MLDCTKNFKLLEVCEILSSKKSFFEGNAKQMFVEEHWQEDFPQLSLQLFLLVLFLLQQLFETFLLLFIQQLLVDDVFTQERWLIGNAKKQSVQKESNMYNAFFKILAKIKEFVLYVYFKQMFNVNNSIVENCN